MSEIRINQVDILPVTPKSGHVGFASFVINDAFKIFNIGIYKNLDGSFRLRYPERIVASQRMSIFFPINKEVADQVVSEVQKAYEALFENEHKRRSDEKAHIN